MYNYTLSTIYIVLSIHKSIINLLWLFFLVKGYSTVEKVAICMTSEDHGASVMDVKDLNPTVLTNRLQALGWTSYRLAKEVAKVRADMYGEVIENPKSLVNGINACLKDPDRSSGRMLECIIKAMGGSLSVKWTTEKIVKTTEEMEENL
jgi:hypothetical protein